MTSQCNGPGRRVRFLKFVSRSVAGPAVDRPYVMLQMQIDYAQRSLPNPGSVWSSNPMAVFFWVSVILLLVTAAATALPAFGPYYSGSPLLVLARSGQFVMFYGKWFAAAFLAISAPWAWFFRGAGWTSRIPVGIGIALVVFYWLLAQGDGAYSRMLYGRC